MRTVIACPTRVKAFLVVGGVRGRRERRRVRDVKPRVRCRRGGRDWRDGVGGEGEVRMKRRVVIPR